MANIGLSQEGGFEQLIDFIHDVVELIEEIVQELVESDQVGEFTDYLSPAPGLVRGQAEVVVDAIRSGDYDPALIEHNLNAGSPAWIFKYQGSERTGVIG